MAWSAAALRVRPFGVTDKLVMCTCAGSLGMLNEKLPNELSALPSGLPLGSTWTLIVCGPVWVMAKAKQANIKLKLQL